MCRSRIVRAISRLKTTIGWYFGLSGVVAVLALGVLIATYVPNTFLASNQDKILGNLVTIFFGAVSGLSLKEIQNKRERILLLEFVIEEYEDVERAGCLPGSPERLTVDQHCSQVIGKVLTGS